MNAVAKLLESITGSYDERLGVIAEIIDASNNSVSVCETKGLELPIIYANKGFLELSGYSFEEVLGLHCLFLQKDDTDQAEAATLLEAIQNGKSTQVTLRNYRKDGSCFYNELHATPVFTPKLAGQTPSRYVIIVQNDVTDLYSIEADLNEAVAASLRDSETLTQQILSRIQSLGYAPVRSALRSFKPDEQQLLERLAKPPSKRVLAEQMGWDEEKLDAILKQLQTNLDVDGLSQIQAWALQTYNHKAAVETFKTLN